MSKVLKDYADYVTEHIKCSTLNSNNYIGMDNMIPNKGGIKESDYTPNTGTAVAFQKGDILIGNIRPYFKKIWYATFNGGCSQDVLCIRSKGILSSKYLYGALAQDLFFDYDMAGAKGSKMPRGDKNHIMNFPIVYSNQHQKIGDFIISIYNKMQNNNKIISELESMAKTIYDYWFLQYEFPNEEGKPYKSSGGKMVYNEELKREIPVGWKVESLSKLATFNNGINYDKDEIGDKKYKIINVRNITSSSLLINDSELDDIELKKIQGDKYLVESNDILIARSGTPGAVRLLLSNPDDIIYCGFIIKCKPNNEKHRLLLTYYLKMLEGSNATKTGGSIMQNVSQDTLKQVKICLPTESVISIFNEKILTLLNKMQCLIKENEELTKLRDELLPLLMNGQVSFKN